MSRRGPSPARLAREAAGLSLAQVARYLRTTESALDRLERAGRGWSYARAVKLARLYRCSIECFPPGGPARKLSPSVLAVLEGER